LLVLVIGLIGRIVAQTPPPQSLLTWQQVRERFLASNPNLIAGRLAIRQAEANEVTAGLRPNPNLSIVEDEFRIFHPNPQQPFQNAQLTHQVTQLIERRNKRDLRVASARLSTSIATTDQGDLERQMTFALRDAFIRTLQAKSLLELARQNLEHYDKVIAVNRERFKAGDISKADLDRVELQRVQFESDLENSQVNLRTAKLNLLALLNDRQPVDGFDVVGDFDFKEAAVTLEELRQAALDSRPDLKSAVTAVRRAENDNRLAWANGSTDPVVGFEYQRTGPDNTAGIIFQIPLRIFDRNQGEKARTALEVRRSEQIRASIVAGIYQNVESAYATMNSVVTLLKPYRDKYLAQAADVRETVSYSYAHGGASLLEFLDAQKSYRDVQLNYRNLIASYLSAVNQLNLAAGREVIP
jgi:cobalt-zinc-cadmium efflux system outer membrane protein